MKCAGALVVTVAVVVAITLNASRAEGHAVGLSRGAYVAEGEMLLAEIVLARAEAIAIVPELDPDRDGEIAETDLVRAQAAITTAFVDRVVVTGDGAVCPGALVSVRLTEADGIVVRSRYTCPKAPRIMHLELQFVGNLSFGHRHQAVLTSGSTSVDVLAHRGETSFDLTVEPKAPATMTPGSTESRRGYAWALFVLGVEHILTGYDHLLFLLALVLIGGRARALVATVTAFTLGHSASLALATLGTFAPSPRIIEPAIALSIAYVGIENLFVVRPAARWRITLPFGFVHGFGFAGVLRDLDLPRAKVPLALAMFNVGVEAGQIAILAILLPLIFYALQSDWFRDRGVRWASGSIAIAGFVWFVARLLVQRT